MIVQTEQTLYRLDQLNAEQKRISYQKSTGKILEKGSDDAVLFSREIYIDDKINIYNGLKTQIEKTNAANEVSDSSMVEVKNILEYSKSELLKASTATTTEDGKKSIAITLKNMKQNLLDLANTRVGGEYLFSGSDGSLRPFEEDANGKVTYSGDNSLKQAAIEYGSYRERGINGLSMMYYSTDTATKTDTTLNFREGQRILDQDGNEWKLDAEKTNLVKYDYNGNITTDTASVTSAGTPPVYTFDLTAKYGATIPNGTRFEAKESIFDMFDNIINTLNGVDSTGASITKAEASSLINKNISEMNSAFDAANIAHAELGARNKAFEISLDAVSSKLTQYNILSQEIGAVDLSKVAVEAKALELTYTALYSTINKTNQLSLVNFIN